MYEVGDKVIYQGADKNAYKKVGVLKSIEEKDGKPQLTVEFEGGETFTAPVDDWSKEFTNAATNAKFKVGDKVEVHTTSGGEINAPRKIKGTVTKLDNGYGKVVVGYRDPWGYEQEVFCNPSEIVKVFSNSSPCVSTNSVVRNAMAANAVVRNAKDGYAEIVSAESDFYIAFRILMSAIRKYPEAKAALEKPYAAVDNEIRKAQSVFEKWRR